MRGGQVPDAGAATVHRSTERPEGPILVGVYGGYGGGPGTDRDGPIVQDEQEVVVPDPWPQTQGDLAQRARGELDARHGVQLFGETPAMDAVRNGRPEP